MQQFSTNGDAVPSEELKIAEESRFQPTLKGAAKMLACFVEKLDRIADTLCAFLRAYEHFGHAQNRPLL
jgi:hypothetical protein